MNNKLERFKDTLKQSNIAVIGLGVSNIPLVDYLSNLACNVTVFNSKILDEQLIDKLNKYNYKYFMGEDYLDNLINFDIIFRSPSCLPTNEKIVKEKERGAIVTSEIKEVLRLSNSKIIGVTGSDGKTTTTTLINEILKANGYNTFLGGNIGIPLFDKIDNMTSDDIVVLELSSFQLMDMDISPDISIITNIEQNHLDIHSSFEEYINAKENIYKYQDKSGILVTNYDNNITNINEEDIIDYCKYMINSQNSKIRKSGINLLCQIFIEP